MYASRDALVKQAIETLGPQVAGVTVTVKRVKLEPAEGRGTISGLEVGNPPGYKSPRSLVLGEMRLAIDYSTLTSGVVRIREIALQGPVITYEAGPGGDNLAAIQKHIDAQVAKYAGAGGSQSSSGRKFIIDNIHVRDAKVQLGEALSMTMPDVHLRDVGKRSNGATADEVIKSVWGSVAGGATNVASRAGQAVKAGARTLIDGARGLFK